jgi:hypothetical protein
MAFVARDKFVVNRAGNARVRISDISDDFREWFLRKEERPFGGSIVKYGMLTDPYNSSGDSILRELGGEEKAETTLTETFALMAAQPNGEAGPLITRFSRPNLFFVRDADGVLRTVCIRWCLGPFLGWVVHAFAVTRQPGWCEGCQVFSRGSSLVEKKHFPTWKTIKLGTFKSVNELSTALTSKGFEIDQYWAAPMLNNHVTLAPAETEIELVKVTARQLGFDRNTPRGEIYARAFEAGLEVLPAEAGPQLRLQCLDEPRLEGEPILIGMEPIGGEHPRVFALRVEFPDERYSSRTKIGLWLKTGNADPYGLCDLDLHHWVFGRGKQD